jgi:hypothetical protein
MSFIRTLVGNDHKSAKQKAAILNERRRQAQAWLRRSKNQKKQQDTVSKK